MNSPAPLMRLDEAERGYWALLVALRNATWTNSDNLIACQVCRDLAFLEGLAREYPDAPIMADTCRRAHEGLRRLSLDRGMIFTRRTPQAKIVHAILDGV